MCVKSLYMASDYSFELKPPCKSRSLGFYESEYNKSSMGVLVTGPWSMSQPMSRIYSGNYPLEDERKDISSVDVGSSSRNGSPSRRISGSFSLPSYVLVAPTSCCYDPIMEPRVVSRPLPPIPPPSRATQVLKQSDNKPPASSPQPTCVPWLKKIKVLKKLQKKIGMGSRGSGGPSVNNVSPLLFHNVHGENINISENGTVARRVSSFCKAIVFSDRPLKVNEKVCIKFLEVSTNWSGVLRFGFTNNDPSSLRSCLPRYACPDLTTKSGFWAKAFNDVHVKKDAILYYYVNQTGDVNFGINGEDKGIFFSGVDTRGSLWALIDIYGNTTGIEFVDVRAHLNNLRRNITDMSNTILSDVNSTLVPSFNAMQVGGTSCLTEKFPEIRYYPNTIRGSLLFHRTKGQHAEIGTYRCMAWRRTNEYSNGFVFTATPIQPDESFVIQVQQSDPEFASSMAFGLTSCDPDTIQSVALPDDSHFLLDRPEYWVVKKDAANSPIAGDELCFTMTHAGEVHMSKNGGPPTTLMYVDNSIPLWAFFDIYGTTTKIFLLGKIPALPRQSAVNAEPRNSLQRSTALTSSSSFTSVPNNVFDHAAAANNYSYLFSGPRPSMPRSQSSTLPGSTLNSNLGTININSNIDSVHQAPLPVISTPQANGSVSANNTINNNVEGIAALSSPLYSTSSREAHNNWAVECVICCERPVDSVFYSCGHMCMCYQCAIAYWKTKDKGWCPICRAAIADVIKTYKS